MTIELPIWMQDNAYPARLDRGMLASIIAEGLLHGFVVSQTGAGANMAVDVSSGRAVITGDDQPEQGNYYVRSTAIENVSGFTAPGSNSRIDIIVLQINDPNAGGGAGSNMTIERVAGTAAASPVPPVTPASALLLAEVGPILPSTTSITDAMIDNVADVAQLAYDLVVDGNVTRIGTSAATAGALMRRDGAGRVAVADGVAAGDAVTKGQLDAFGARTSGFLGTGNVVKYTRYGTGTGALVVVRSNPAVPDSVTSVVLPVGFRPASEVRVPSSYGTDGNRVTIATNGTVTIPSSPGENTGFIAVFDAA